MKITRSKTSRLDQVDFDNLGFGAGLSDHVFRAEYKDGQWHDGVIEPYGHLRQGLGLHALHYGQAVFEGQKAYKQADGGIAVFRPERNYERINLSGERMCIPAIPKDLFMNGLMELIRVDRDWVPSGENQALYLRPFTFASAEWVIAKASDQYTFGIVTCPVGELYSGAIKVKIEQEFTRATQGGVGFAKAAGNYGGSFLATRKAVEEGFSQVLWTDHKEHKFIEEAGTMNVALIINDVLVTPKLSDTILAGITRDSILTLVREWGIEVQERDITVDELLDSVKSGDLQEAFGMGTAAVISPINGFGYQGTVIDCPFKEDGMAMRIKAALSDIRYGRVEDSHGWMHRI